MDTYGCDILRPLCFNRILFTDKISHWDTRQIIPAIFIAILVAIITYNANPEFDADETVYLPALKSQTKISGAIADKISCEQNFNKTNDKAQGAQDEAAKFEQKFKRVFK